MSVTYSSDAGVEQDDLVVKASHLHMSQCMLHKKIGPISAAKFVKDLRKMVLTNSGF